jgi:hypothetical protein
MQGKMYLVTGAAGNMGSEVVGRLWHKKPFEEGMHDYSSNLCLFADRGAHKLGDLRIS